jgi:hypothetical protein
MNKIVTAGDATTFYKAVRTDFGLSKAASAMRNFLIFFRLSLVTFVLLFLNILILVKYRTNVNKRRYIGLLKTTPFKSNLGTMIILLITSFLYISLNIPILVFYTLQRTLKYDLKNISWLHFVSQGLIFFLILFKLFLCYLLSKQIKQKLNSILKRFFVKIKFYLN